MLFRDRHLAKSLAGALQPGDHGTTFGGSPVPAAAAFEHLHVRDALDLDTQVEVAGTLLRDEVAAIARDWPEVFAEPRGHGLMLGLPVYEQRTAAAAFVAPGLDEGLLINAAGRNTLRLVPPLIISAGEIRDAMSRLRRTIETVLASPSNR
jgi:acetylornithine/succinyldiaminopimelate/putrescine aminotransferase